MKLDLIEKELLVHNFTNVPCKKINSFEELLKIKLGSKIVISSKNEDEFIICKIISMAGDKDCGEICVSNGLTYFDIYNDSLEIEDYRCYTMPKELGKYI